MKAEVGSAKPDVQRPRWWKHPAVLNAALGWLGIGLIGVGVAWLSAPVSLIVVGGLLYVDSVLIKR